MLNIYKIYEITLAKTFIYKMLITMFQMNFAFYTNINEIQKKKTFAK